ncbi:hypothetical protein [Oryzomicrobium sp.]|uniref:pilus assembly PilX family protein n=1 Tax=Oryzomicrobium sp. TaxID=1911578 RepID=UPI0025EC78C1|nr:hypothetical protein [Oryzomicrobium sp.]MCE1241777.1 hypothetical protein [Oryzomicrobium sp.]
MDQSLTTAGKHLPFKRERGIVLLIALIGLFAMTMAGLALIRGVSTTNVIAGNLAFKQAALHAADNGVERAFLDLGNTFIGNMNTNQPANCTTNCTYYATTRKTDANGIPYQEQFDVTATSTPINWASVATSQTVNGAFVTQYVIDRLCNGVTTTTNIASTCYSGTSAGGGSKKVGSASFTNPQQIYYRITIRVSGPRNTISMTQAIVTE